MSWAAFSGLGLVDVGRRRMLMGVWAAEGWDCREWIRERPSSLAPRTRIECLADILASCSRGES